LLIWRVFKIGLSPAVLGAAKDWVWWDQPFNLVSSTALHWMANGRFPALRRVRMVNHFKGALSAATPQAG